MGTGGRSSRSCFTESSGKCRPVAPAIQYDERAPGKHAKRRESLAAPFCVARVFRGHFFIRRGATIVGASLPVCRTTRKVAIVTWPAFVQAARVRAVEETDAEGKVWDAELRRELTREAGQG